MKAGTYEPYSEAGGKTGWQRKTFFEEYKRGYVEKDTGKDPPDRAPGELLHYLQIAFMIKIDPNQDNCAGERHNAYQTGKRRKSFADHYRSKDNSETYEELYDCLHHGSFLQVISKKFYLGTPLVRRIVSIRY